MMNKLTDRVPNAIGAPTGGSRPVAGRDPQGATPAKDAWRVVSEARDSIGHGTAAGARAGDRLLVAEATSKHPRGK